MSIVVGIDFGTTNSCVSYVRASGGVATLVPNLDGDFTTPTCVYFSPDSSEILFGKEAARKTGSIGNFKRLIGIKYDDYLADEELKTFFCKRGVHVVQDIASDFCAIETSYNGDTCVFSVGEISRLFFGHLSEFTKWAIDFDIRGAVVTVPAHFTDTARQIVKGACEAAGFPVLRMLNEPTAAAMTCRPRDTRDTCVTLVVDCGGGTTDISLVSMDDANRMYEVVRTAGERFLGGEDLTQTLVKNVVAKLEGKGHVITQNDMRLLTKVCEAAKCHLTYQYTTHLYIKDELPVIPVSQSRMLSDAAPFFQKIAGLVQEVVLGIPAIDRVVFVGGTSRIGYLKESVFRALGDKAPTGNAGDAGVGPDPDHSVSMGASYYGHVISGDDSGDGDEDGGVLLVDVLSQTIGVETNGGFMTPIVSKNTALPVSKKTVFTNSEEDVDTIEIDIYQGERKFVKDNAHLGHFTLRGVDKSYAVGEMRIEVTVDIDTDGIMTVSAKELSSKATSTGITIGVSQFADVALHDDTASDTASDDSDVMFSDSKRTELVLAKLELENVVKRNRRLLENTDVVQDQEAFQPMDDLIRKTESVLAFFEEHTPQFLKNAALDFMDEFHRIMSDTT
jgi:molecular chaperone DnaK (HSP70)